MHVVYALVDDSYEREQELGRGQFLYVGQTGNLRKRRLQHARVYPTLHLIVLWEDLTAECARFIERHCIEMWDPPLNGRYRLSRQQYGQQLLGL